MQITRLTIKNFRNLDGVDVELVESPVIVGENRVGKSNLVHAIRLVCDPGLSNAARWLGQEDFSDHLGPDPMGVGAEIRVALEIEGFEDQPRVIAALRNALSASDPMRARLTYLFGPQSLEGDDGEGLSADAYRWSIVGGRDDDPKDIPGALRAHLHQEHLHALRDVQSDLSSWRRSPLRRLLDQAVGEAERADLENLREAVEAANEATNALDSVRELGERVAAETERLVGGLHALEPSLRVGSTDPERLIRDLRIFLDGSEQRALHAASLGSLNVLYLALLELELRRRLAGGEIQHALITIEEPEAHLHPHLQRRVFRKVAATDGETRSTLVTTHSAHIVSVTHPWRLVFLRHGETGSVACAASDADLSDHEWRDIARYLDVTRAEMVFARKVLLVEGLAEQLVIPLIADQKNIDLDSEGITVCAIGGVHFAPYVRFLRAIGTPHAVITDGDPRGPAHATGLARMTHLMERLDLSGEEPESAGLFYGEDTLERDFFAVNDENQDEIISVLSEFDWPGSVEAELQSAAEGEPMAPDRVEELISTAGKGRFAQRLAGRGHALEPPAYIERALSHLAADKD